MAIVAGVDFGTLSVRVSILDSKRGRLGTAVAEYPLHRKREDPDYATQAHADQMRALAAATRKAVASAGISGDQVEAIALDTTGSSVVPVDAAMQPLDDYYLWCDHRAHDEAQQITALAHAEKLEAIEWCGGVYSHEWGFAKLLHWLRHNPDKRARFASALEHCDMVAATLCGITDPRQVKRSVCAMGHKWMWNPKWGGLPPQSFLVEARSALRRRTRETGRRLPDLRSHRRPSLAAVGRGAGPASRHPHSRGRLRRALGRHRRRLPRGRRGQRRRHLHLHHRHGQADRPHPRRLRRGAGQRASRSTRESKPGCRPPATSSKPSPGARASRSQRWPQGLENYRAGQTGLLRLSWDNGDRTVLVNPELGGVTLGWNLIHTAQDELFAAIEGTAFHTRIILERMAEHGVPRRARDQRRRHSAEQRRCSTRSTPTCWASRCWCPPGVPTSLGSGIFAMVAAGAYPTVEAAQDALCLKFTTISPDPAAAPIYERLYALYKKTYFALGTRSAPAVPLGDVLPELRKIASQRN